MASGAPLLLSFASVVLSFYSLVPYLRKTLAAADSSNEQVRGVSLAYLRELCRKHPNATLSEVLVAEGHHAGECVRIRS